MTALKTNHNAPFLKRTITGIFYFRQNLDDRYQRSSTLITSQLPVSLWHNSIGDATLGDAILDRLMHNAHRIELAGESMRKNKAQKLEKKEN